MKKVFTALLLLGLSGTAFAAVQIHTGAIPAEVKAILASPAIEANPAQQYADSAKQKASEHQQQLNKVLSEKGYLIGTRNAVRVQDDIDELKAQAATLDQYASITGKNLHLATLLLKYLNAAYNSPAQNVLGGSTNPAQQYADDAEKEVSSFEEELQTLSNKNPSIKENPAYSLVQKYIEELGPEIGQIGPAAGDVSSALVLIPQQLEQLSAIRPKEFPGLCYSYEGKGKKLTGVIEYAPGSKTTLYFYPVPYNEKTHYNFLQAKGGGFDVGLIGNGKEDTPSTTLPGRNIDAWLGKDPQTGAEVVFCLGKPIPVTSSASPSQPDEGNK